MPEASLKLQVFKKNVNDTMDVRGDHQLDF